MFPLSFLQLKWNELLCSLFSFSLEGLTGEAGVGNKPSSSLDRNSVNAKELRHPFSGEERGDSLVSLSEEDLEADQGEHRMFGQQVRLKCICVVNLEKNFPEYVLILGPKKGKIDLH